MEKFASLVVGMVFLAVSTTGLWAQTAVATSSQPETISYQGLLNSAGTPANGTFDLHFSLYSDTEGRDIVWQGTYASQVTNGVFNVALGSGENPLPASAKLDGPLYLGIRVGSDAELRPLSMVGASFNALNVADGSITAKKISADYVGSISVNGSKITANGSNLNFAAGDGLELNYDPTSSTILLSGSTGSAKRGGFHTLSSPTVSMTSTADGVTNTLAKFTGTSSIDNSALTDNGTTFGAGTHFSVTEASGNTTVGGTLGVTGATTLGTLGAGNTTVSGTLGATGNATVGGALGVTGATTISGALNYPGMATASASGNYTMHVQNSSNAILGGPTVTRNGESWSIAATATVATTAPLSYNTGTISISQANTITNGYLSSTDWNTFNGKQNAIPANTYDAYGAATTAQNNAINHFSAGTGIGLAIGGAISNSGVLSFNGRTGAVTPASGDYSSYYDASGAAATAQSNAIAHFTPGTGIAITSGGQISFDVSSVTAGGDLSGNYPNPTVATVGAVTAANVASGANAANAATSTNTASTIVKRDASGNFSAGTITGNLTGNASGNAGTATKLQTARTINGVGFDGTQNITIPTSSGTAGGDLAGTYPNPTIANSASAGNDVVAAVNHAASGNNINNPTMNVTAAAANFTTVQFSSSLMPAGHAGNSGQVLVSNGSGHAPSWSSVAPGLVSSVFGRTGAITAQSGDYSFSQISGILTVAQGGTGLIASTGTQFLRGDGLGAWTTGNLGIGDIPNLSGTYATLAQAQGDATTAQTTAESYSSNATNLTSGTVSAVRLPDLSGTYATLAQAQTDATTAQTTAESYSSNATNLTSGTVSAVRLPDLSGTYATLAQAQTDATTAQNTAELYSSNATNLTSGTVSAARLPDLSGTYATLAQAQTDATTAQNTAELYSSNATNLTSGTVSAARLPDLSGTYATLAQAQGDATTAQTTAELYSSNATNLTSGTVSSARLPDLSGTYATLAQAQTDATTAQTTAESYSSNATNLTSGMVSAARLPANLVTTPGGTTNTISKFTGANSVGNSSMTDNGATVTVGGNLTVTGNTNLSGITGGYFASSGATASIPSTAFMVEITNPGGPGIVTISLPVVVNGKEMHIHNGASAPTAGDVIVPPGGMFTVMGTGNAWVLEKN